MPAPALAMLVGWKRGAEVRNDPETLAGPEGGAELGWRHGVRKRTRCLGCGCCGRAGAAPAREALSGGEERADLADRPRLRTTLRNATTRERSDWCQGWKGPALREGSHPTRHGDVLRKLCDGHGCWRRDSPPALTVRPTEGRLDLRPENFEKPEEVGGGISTPLQGSSLFESHYLCGKLNAEHHKITVRQNISAQKNTTTMGPKLDESVEIRPKSPDVNLETGVDVSVMRNNHVGPLTAQGLSRAPAMLFEKFTKNKNCASKCYSIRSRQSNQKNSK